MSTSFYLTHRTDKTFNDPTECLVGDVEFYQLVASCECDVHCVSEYDGAYEIRPKDFEAVRAKMKESTDVQEAHFEILDLVESNHGIYMGLSY